MLMLKSPINPAEADGKVLSFGHKPKDWEIDLLQREEKSKVSY